MITVVWGESKVFARRKGLSRLVFIPCHLPKSKDGLRLFLTFSRRVIPRQRKMGTVLLVLCFTLSESKPFGPPVALASTADFGRDWVERTGGLYGGKTQQGHAVSAKEDAIQRRT